MSDDSKAAIFLGVVIIIICCFAITPLILYHNRETEKIKMSQELVQKGANPIDVGCMIEVNGTNAAICELRARNKGE
ncbi:MAG: hypothetical protein H7836_17480 [Magnetococcus sp. YQC-3]